MARFISQDTVLETRQLGDKLVTEYAIGEQVKKFEIPRHPDGTLKRLRPTKPFGEFLGTGNMVEELAQYVTVDIESGRQDVPLLYKSIYNTQTNPNFPRLIDSGFSIYADVVFLQHLEGQEVRFGTTRGEMGPTVPILTYSAGFEWDEDVEVYDEGWKVSIANEAMGKAHNALLNHLHFSPIMDADYTVATGFGNETAYQVHASGDRLESIRLTIRQAMFDAAQKVDGNGRKHAIRPTIALCNLATAYEVNDSLNLIQDQSGIGPAGSEPIFIGRRSDTAGPNPSVNQVGTVIAYEGESMQMGNLVWNYGTMADNKVYLIQPKRNMFEFIKHDLRVDTERPADLSRLVAAQMVARTRRGLLAVPESTVWEVNLA
jgi:hypothetical protein